MTTALPIDDALPALLDALRSGGRAVLQAPPGAGKTTRVPLAILAAELAKGRIVMLEPRRLAVRAAAERMAESLGEPVGRTVGYRMRGQSKVSKATRIEVVTEGILTRMLQFDAELNGIGALIFDEFHERSLNADLGLALAWEVRAALRPDLILLVMSATLDAGPVAKLLDDAPLITSRGESFEVQTRWLDRPVPNDTRFEAAMAGLIRQALAETSGGVLAFLPGEGEIRRLAAYLGDLPGDVSLHPLYGALPFATQHAAIAPSLQGRKLVLSTSIAETALTIRDVRVVVDGGQARRARFDPGRGMTRLVTERVTRAEAVQRRGRAGRVQTGWCYRLWTRGEDGALAAFPPPEIASADLTGLALELALWGAEPKGLSFLTPPPEQALAEARGLLQGLGALDDAGRLSGHGRMLAGLPLHPRLAHMLAVAGPRAATLAAILNDRDPLRGVGVDLALRTEAVHNPARHPAARAALDRIATEAKRLRSLLGKRAPGAELGLAEQAALAYPDRIGLRRSGAAPRWVLSKGTGAVMDAHDPLAASRLIVATDLDGGGREARIRQAIAISESEVRGLYADRISWMDHCEWSRRERRVVARQQEKLGALVLVDRVWTDAPSDTVARAMLDGVRDLGLPWAAPAARLRARIELMRFEGADLPDCSDPGLMGDLDWLLPYLDGVVTAADLARLDLSEALKARLGWAQQQILDRLAPAHFITPMGRKVALDYSCGVPEIAVRLQEMLGVVQHPAIGPHKLPLKVTLLSPSGRPLQTTTDLPGFWATSYGDVRKDMRGRYPKHPWPEDPAQAEPTLRAKPRK